MTVEKSKKTEMTTGTVKNKEDAPVFVLSSTR